jgi:hypothetical protein
MRIQSRRICSVQNMDMTTNSQHLSQATEECKIEWFQRDCVLVMLILHFHHRKRSHPVIVGGTLTGNSLLQVSVVEE